LRSEAAEKMRGIVFAIRRSASISWHCPESLQARRSHPRVRRQSANRLAWAARKFHRHPKFESQNRRLPDAKPILDLGAVTKPTRGTQDPTHPPEINWRRGVDAAGV
jgi:hypothetical protein